MIRHVITGIGIGMIGLALLGLFRPSILVGMMPTIGMYSSIALGMAAALIATVYGIESFKKGRLTTRDVPIRPETPPETITDHDNATVMDFDAETPHTAREQMISTVKHILIELYRMSDDNANNSIAAGKWTKNRIAAAFLSPHVSYSVLERLREWLEDDGTTERRMQTTITAIEKLYKRGQER